MINQIILLALLGCTIIPKKIPLKSDGGWKEIFESSTNADPKDPSRWTVSDGSISFHGNLVQGDCDKFKTLVTAETKTLIVRSQGGPVSEGLCIAQAMKKNNFAKTIVSGVCFSSCANYLFLGSPSRIIQSGVVGFHGNINALVKQNPEMIAKSNPYREKFLEEMKVEMNFLEELGVSQEFFDLTQRADKGNDDNGKYSFLVPSPETFEKFGMKNIKGTQDQDLVKLLWEKGFLLLYK